MSDLTIPARHELLTTMALFTRIMPLARPRMRWRVKGVYQPTENQKDLRDALTLYPSLQLSQPVIIDTYISIRRPKRTKLIHPSGRGHGDEDNLRKAINDALIDREILADDSLILGGENFKFFGEEDLCVIKVWSLHPHSHLRVNYV